MSDIDEEYEVEVIQRAKVEQDKRGRKTWKYYVKWKGYGQDANTWEPFSSFEGSEHFVDNFWNRVGSDRDYTQMKLFKAGEELFPVGPPGKMKIKKDATRKDDVQTPKRPIKRRDTDSEVEVQTLIEEDPEEQVSARRSTRKRRASVTEQAEEAPAKRRRSRAPVQIESDEDEVVLPRTSARRASASQAKAVPQTNTSTRTTRASASPSKPSARSRSTARARPRVSKPSDEVIEIVSDSEDEPAAMPEEDPVSKPSSSTAYVDVPPSPSKTNGSPRKAATNSRRGGKEPATKVNDTAAEESDGAPVVKSRPTRKPKSTATEAAGPSTSATNGKPGPAGPRRTIRGSKAGPGRSSQGVVAASTTRPATTKPGPGRSSQGITIGGTSTAPVAPGGGLKTPRKRAVNPRPVKSRLTTPAADPDAMAVDDAEDPLLAPLSTEDLTHLARLTQTPAPEPAPEVPSYEGVSDRDADGESDHELVNHDQPPQVSPKMKSKKPLSSKAAVAHDAGEVKKQNNDAQPVEETSIDDTATQAPKQVIINPPNATIGGHLERSNSSAWKPPTIFDNASFSSFHSPIDPPASSSQPSASTLLIPISPSVKVSVLIKDAHPPVDSTRKHLDEIPSQEQPGPPGKFYKGQTAQDMLKALNCGGSCARVVTKTDADNDEKATFERLHSYLKDGNLFIAIVGSVILAFCASTNGDAVAELGISPNLVGLGDNILVSEVVIADDAAYCDAVINTEDVRW